uniref:Uncharacterized protein n=1 Tax=candidate division CPR3 bacterium TaxID=2268181 RepID=A0A7V3JAA7_UNCC3
METTAKPWYLSKTIWVNLIAFIAMIVQNLTHFVISPEEEAAILAVINLILRMITKKPIV